MMDVGAGHEQYWSLALVQDFLGSRGGESITVSSTISWVRAVVLVSTAFLMPALCSFTHVIPLDLGGVTK